MPYSEAPLLIGGPFNLFKVPNMFAYWTADNVTLSGNTIITLANQSGVGTSSRDLTRVANPGPDYIASDPNFNYYPSISGTASNGPRLQATTFDTSLSQPYTIYLVHRIETNASTVFWRTLGGNYDNSGGYYISGTAARLQTSNSSGNSLLYNSSSNGNKVMCAVYNGMTTDTAMYYNNSTTPVAVYPSQGGVDFTTINGLTIGSFFSAVTYSWAAQIIYAGAHNQTTRAKIMQFLGAKYGISVI